MARVYGFGSKLSAQQSWAQTWMLLLVFVLLAVPLGISLKQIATEAVTVNQVRSVLAQRFGNAARVTQLDVDFSADPLVVRSVVIAPRDRIQRADDVQGELARRLDRPVRLEMDQVALEPGAGALEAQREELRRAGDLTGRQDGALATPAPTLSLAAGVNADQVTIDREHRRATVNAMSLPDATLDTYRALEHRVAAENAGWDIRLVPPPGPLPLIAFEGDADTLSDAARTAVLTSVWAAQRWNVRQLMVPGLTDPPAETPNLAQRRAAAIAALLRQQGVEPLAASPQGSSFRLGRADEGTMR